MKKLLIFDLDGTLLDTLADLRNSVNFALKKFGLPQRSMEEIRNSVGNGFRHLVVTSLPPEVTDADKVLQIAREHYRKHYCEETQPYAGILSMLEQLKKDGYNLAIVSNKPDVMVKGLWERFFKSTVLYAMGETDGVPRKPAPDMVHAVMESFGAHESVYIGDSEVDVLTARNAQIECISVTWGFRTGAELINTGAESLCDSPAELYNQVHLCAQYPAEA